MFSYFMEFFFGFRIQLHFGLLFNEGNTSKLDPRKVLSTIVLPIMIGKYNHRDGTHI